MKNLVLLTKSRVLALPKSRTLQGTFAQALLASWFIVLAAQFKVPFYPVPMVMQDFAIMLIALLASWNVAVGAVVLLISYALIGMPVLASGAVGLQVLLEPSAGYRLGYVLMSGVIAALAQHYRDSSIWMRFGFVLLGNLCLYVPGLSFLAYLFDWETAFKVGFMPFVLMIPVKVALAAYLSVYIQDKYARKISST